ncbi:RsiV family protein [Prescottella equi]
MDAAPQPTASAVAPASTATSPPPAENAYTATTVHVTGDTGRVRYDVVVPQIEGGDPAVAAEFDESMRAALQDQIDGWPGDRFTLESTDRSSVVHIGSRVVSGLLVTSWNADPPGAHPTPLVATVVIADDAQPVTLDRLFPDLRAGLDRLSEESAELLPATAAGPDFLREGIEPKRENFANWVATPAGMEIHFTDYQVGPHAIGLIVVTVPWDRLSDVVAPDLVGVVSS